MNSKTFTSKDGMNLIVKHRKSAVVFEIEPIEVKNEYDFSFHFDSEVFNELLDHLEDISTKAWSNLNPKEAYSEGSDYYEYYDREFDTNGYLRIHENILNIERPSLERTRLYQFNKKKMESFIYDFRKIVSAKTA